MVYWVLFGDMKLSRWWLGCSDYYNSVILFTNTFVWAISTSLVSPLERIQWWVTKLVHHAIHMHCTNGGVGEYSPAVTLATGGLTTWTVIITIPILGSLRLYLWYLCILVRVKMLHGRQLPPIAVGGGCISLFPHCMYKGSYPCPMPGHALCIFQPKTLH